VVGNPAHSRVLELMVIVVLFNPGHYIVLLYDFDPSFLEEAWIKETEKTIWQKSNIFGQTRLLPAALVQKFAL